MKRVGGMVRFQGFTLVELLVVVGVTVTLLAILVPTLTQARGAAYSIRCASNVRQIAIGQFLYADDNQGHFTAQWDNPQGTSLDPATSTWTRKLQGYVVSHYSSEWGEQIQGGRNDNVFNCPSRVLHATQLTWPAYALNGYMRTAASGQAHPWHAWGYRRDRVLRPSQIILVGDLRDFQSWEYMRPTDFGFPWTADDVPGTTGNLPGFRHGAVSRTDPEGRPVARANMAFCDGHVESLTWDGLRMGKPGADSRWKWWSNDSPP